MPRYIPKGIRIRLERVFRLTVIPGRDPGIPVHAVVRGDPRIRSGDEVGPGDGVERRDGVVCVFRLTVIPGLDPGIPVHAVVLGDPRIRSGDDVVPGDDVERRDVVERAVRPSKSSSDDSFILMSVGDTAAVSRVRPPGRGEP
jgi:hypothetical protein